MSEGVGPDQVVQAARSWIGVRYRHQGRTRAGGIDCAGLVVRVAADLGLSTFDTTGYARVPDGQAMRAMLRELCAEREPGAFTPGAVALFTFDVDPQHLGIIAPYPQGAGLSLIHALAQERRVVEHRIDHVWRARCAGVFELPGVAYPS